MKKFLKTKLAMSLALALTMGSFLSVSTTPVVAQETISEEMIIDDEAAFAITSLARAAWRTKAVRGLAYAAVEELSRLVTTSLLGGAELAQSPSFPVNALD